MADHDQAPTRHPNYPAVSYVEVFRDTGLDENNIIFKSEDIARSYVGAWIEEETGEFKRRTGWTLTDAQLDGMTDYYVLSIKKCIIMMVKVRVYERAIGVRPSERDHYIQLREEIRRKLEGIWGRGGMIRGLVNPAVDVTATGIVYDPDTIAERITDV